jgi:hypothetical protein
MKDVARQGAPKGLVEWNDQNQLLVSFQLWDVADRVLLIVQNRKVIF